MVYDANTAMTWKSIQGHSWTDEQIEQAKRYLRTGELPPDWGKDKKYTFRRRLRFYAVDRNQLVLRPEFVPDEYVRTRFRVVPRSAIDGSLRALIDDPMFVAYSRDRLYDKVMQAGYLGITRAEVGRYLRENPLPSVTGLANVPRRDPVRSYRPSHPNQQWQIDLASMDEDSLVRANDGYRYLVVIIDIFSKFMWIRPLKTKESAEVAQHLHTLFLQGDIPMRLQSDQGTEFLGEVGDLCARFRVERIINAPFSPQTTGVVENAIKHIKNYLSRFMNQFRDAATGLPNKRYIDILDRINFNLNTTKSRVTRMTPFQVHRGTHVDVPVRSSGVPRLNAPVGDESPEMAAELAAHANVNDRRYRDRTGQIRRRIAAEADRREAAVEGGTPRFVPGDQVHVWVANALGPGRLQYVPIRIGSRRIPLPRTRRIPDLAPFVFSSRWADKHYPMAFEIREVRMSTTQTRAYVLKPRGREETVERLVDEGVAPAGTQTSWDARFPASMLRHVEPERRRQRAAQPQYTVPVNLTLPRPLIVPPRRPLGNLSVEEVTRLLDRPELMRSRRIRIWWRMTDDTIRSFDGTVEGPGRGKHAYKVRYDDDPRRLDSRRLYPDDYGKRNQHYGWVFLDG